MYRNLSLHLIGSCRSADIAEQQSIMGCTAVKDPGCVTERNELLCHTC